MRNNHKKEYHIQRDVCDSCGRASWKYLFNNQNGWKIQHCYHCGLAQVIPRPSDKEIAQLYKNDAPHFNPYISQERVHRQYFREKLTHLCNILGQSSVRLLDIGCLTGILLEEANEMGMMAEGLDISEDAVKYCRKKGLIVHHGTVESVKKRYPSKKYAAITAFEIIEHAYSPTSMMRAIYAVLEPGGVVMLTTPNHGSIWRKLMGRYWPGYTHPEHMYFFDPSSLRHLLLSCGFRDIHIQTGDSRPFPLWYLFARGADYFEAFRPLFTMLARCTRYLPITNPLNPWDDLIAVARK